MQKPLVRMSLVLAFGLIPLGLAQAQGLTLGEALDAPELVWTTGPEYYQWNPTTDTTHDGVDAAGSFVPAYADSWVETTVTGPIAVSFWWMCDTFMGGGWMNFFIDGVWQGSLDPDSGWQYAAYGVPDGVHTVQWTLNGGMGGDGASGWLDQVALSPAVPEIEVFGINSAAVSNGTTTTSTWDGTDFGSTFVTGSNVTRTFYLRNWGTADLDVSAVSISGTHSADFQILNFPSVVQPGTTSNWVIRFDPSALGGRTAVVTVVNNDADEGSYTFTVSGTGIADGPYIRIFGNTAQPITNGSMAVTTTLGTDFGLQYLAASSTSRTFAVSNDGNAPLNISAVNRTGAHPGDFAVLSFPETVAAGTRSNLVIQFDPSAIGIRSAVVEIASDGVGAAAYTFAVGGTGMLDTSEISVLGTNGQAVLDGDMAVSSWDGTHFGGTTAFSGSVDRVFGVTNSGSVDLVISNVTFQGVGAVHFSAPSFPGIVVPGTQSNLLIRFSPVAAGVATAVVVIANNDSDENPYEFAVWGEGISTHYVWTNSPTPTPPYLTWDTAARTIQEAANICVDGDVIWVTNGVYDSGGVYKGNNTNRVCITKAVRVQSVNGPEVTSIVGANDIRCVFLGNNSNLAGFTITNGYAGFGGGVYADHSLSSVVSNCIISGNQANYGGGVYWATAYDSVISGNTAVYGGGGAAYADLHRCRLSQNQAGSVQYSIICGEDPWYEGRDTVEGGGGGAYNCSLNSCLLVDNFANAGGGASFSSLVNCTLVSNQAAGITYGSIYTGFIYGGGGGIFAGSAINCIFDSNMDLTVPAKADWDVSTGCYGSGTPSITYSCLTNPPAGSGNVTGRATFVSGTYRLAVGSLGIDIGNNASVQGVTDLDGQPRIVNTTVDIGAYEFVPAAPIVDTDGDGIPDDWESANGLNPAVSNSPSMNSDSDDQPDIDEYIADTQPTNGASFFPRVVVTNPPLGTMVLVVDPTSTARVYGVRWITNLLATPQLWTLIPPEKTGTGSAVTFTVTNDGPGRIYRTGVRLP